MFSYYSSNLWKYKINTRLNYSTSTQAVSPQTLMYWYSLTKTVSFRFGQTQQQLNRSGAVGEETTHILALHLVFHDMFMRAPVEGVSASRLMWTRMTVQDCICASVCVQYADRASEDRLLPCCSLQGLWLARLSRTETSASICVAAPRPYWWAATSCNKHALCRSTPPVGESRAGQEASEESRALPVKQTAL